MAPAGGDMPPFRSAGLAQFAGMTVAPCIKRDCSARSAASAEVRWNPEGNWAARSTSLISHCLSIAADVPLLRSRLFSSQPAAPESGATTSVAVASRAQPLRDKRGRFSVVVVSPLSEGAMQSESAVPDTVCSASCGDLNGFDGVVHGGSAYACRCGEPSTAYAPLASPLLITPGGRTAPESKVLICQSNCDVPSRAR